MILLLTKIYFKIFSLISPEKAGRVAFKAFQKTRRLPFKKHENEFYATARRFDVVHPRESIQGYELGNPHGELIILVHGWESNAGSMGLVASRLAGLGFRVVTFDLPAHGNSILSHTNLKECAEALRAVIYQLRPSSMSIVSHSFGSAVATFALSGTRYKVNHFIMLTSPNQLLTIFDQFKSIVGLGDTAYDELLRLAASILNSPVSWLSVSEKLKHLRYDKLVLIHDKNDRVLPFSNSLEIRKITSARLYVLEDAGHYRMLTSDYVLQLIQNEISPAKEFIMESELLYSHA